METIDFTTADCLEPGDYFEFREIVYKVTSEIDDRGDFVVVSVIDEWDETDDLTIDPADILSIKGYFYDVEV